MNGESFTLLRGTAPLLVSMPHLGQRLPDEMLPGFTAEARRLADTDWHMDRLYDFAPSLGASVLAATVSRYVIDINRPPDGSSLYPGRTTTALCPTETFRGVPLYESGHEPDAAETERRRQRYWQPYHDALKAELARLCTMHDNVLLWEAHSIASVLPRLFDGKLPDLNFGTNDGSACARGIVDAVLAACDGAPFTHVVDARFKGGFITRHYGSPAGGIHAIQLEMCQCIYMDETEPFDYRPDLASTVQPSLRRMLENALGALATM